MGQSYEITVPDDGASPDAAEELKAAETRARQRAEGAHRQETAVVAQRQQEADRIRRTVEDAQVAAIESSLHAAAADGVLAQQRIDDAMIRSDWAAVAREQREMNRIVIRQGTLQRGLDELRPPRPTHEGSVWGPGGAPQPPRQTQPSPAQGEDFGAWNAYVAQMPAPQRQQPREPQRQTHSDRPAPTRRGGSPGSSSRDVVLTAEQREAARFSGVSEHEYALNLMRLRQAKAEGMYQDRNVG